MWNVFKILRPWQIGVLAAVLVGASGATFGVYLLLGDADQTELTEDQQLIPVQYGNLVNEVSVNGSLVFPDRESLSFGAQGTVEEVLVDEGQRVEKGQALASLDVETVATLEKAVAQARVDLQNTEEALAKAKDPHTALDLARAEADVADAILALKDDRDALDALLNPTSQAVARAEATVANAGIKLKDTQDALAGLLEPTAQSLAEAAAVVVAAELRVQDARDALVALLEPASQDMTDAEAAVATARLRLNAAREALDAIENGPADEDVARAKSQVSSAETTLANAQRDLTLTGDEWDGKLQVTRDANAAAVEDYQGVFSKWLGAEVGAQELDLGPEALLDSWGTDLESLFASSLSRYDDVDDDASTPWNELTLWAWRFLHPATITTSCLESQTPRPGEACVQREMDDAWDIYRQAQDDLDTMEILAAKANASAGDAVSRAENSLADAQETLADLTTDADSLEIGSAQADLAVAVAALETAEEDLATLKAGPDPLDVEVREKDLAVAQAALEAAEEDLAALESDPDALEVEGKKKEVALAQADLDRAEEDLAALTGEADPIEVEANRKRVVVAQAALETAEEDLAELRGSVDPLEVALREAQVAEARAVLDTATQRLDGATLTAPWSGTVSFVNVEVGQVVSPNTLVFEMVDPAVVEVDGIVDEIDVLFVQEGARVTVSMDALPGQVLDGSVSDVASAARTQQGVVSYPIRIRLTIPRGVELPEGLSAVASVVIREDTNVLLVPLQSLYGTFDQPVVRVVSSGRIEERAVALGNSDDFWVVIEGGLAEGDQVIMESQQATTSGFGFGNFRRFQGGFTGTSIPGGFGGGSGGGRGQQEDHN